MLCGERQRDAFQDGSEYTFSSSSRSSYAAGLLGLSLSLADAAMVERVISVDVCDVAAERYTGAPGRHAAGGAIVAPETREIEGMGGRFWYEAA